ncbi:MAG: efflux RND transporter permease subunit [Planctomycetes bacterium]|nr:efflux RND transporter permease subunit [Planctomycetota bacterium]
MNSIIAWFAKNTVAANLLMIGTIVMGAMTIGTLKQEVVPMVEVQSAIVSVVYPGAAPEEVEQGICLPIERAVQGLSGVDKVNSVAKENIGVVTVEFLDNVDRNNILNDVKTAVDAIDNFPQDAERAQVKLLDVIGKVMDVVVWGDTSELELRKATTIVENQLLAHPGITLVTLSNAPAFEISIEVSQDMLNRYDLSIDQITAAIQRSSIDIPGGSLFADSGEILLRSNGQAFDANDFSQVMIRNSASGQPLRLGDIATIKDAFAETDQESRFNGKQATMLSVFRVGNQETLVLADYVREALDNAKQKLPAGIQLSIKSDDTKVLNSRLDLMLRNGKSGLLLVLIALGFFLRLRVAMWTTLGIPVSFLGAIILMPLFDVSINLISIFGFIVVLGIVVDDAIVVAENIHEKRRKGMDGLKAAIEGAQEMSKPVIFAVLTTITAFTPMLFMPGNMGQFSRNIPLIVIAVLVFSLIESLLILPAHLRHLPSEVGEKKTGWWIKIQGVADGIIEFMIERMYRPTLNWAMPNRYLILGISIAILTSTTAYVSSGRVNFNFFPQIESDNVIVDIQMPLGVPVEQTETAIMRCEIAAKQLQKELFTSEGLPVIESITTAIGAQPTKLKQQQTGGGMGSSESGSHLSEVHLELIGAEYRDISGNEIIAKLEALIGPIAGAENVSYSADLISSPGDIDLRITGSDPAEVLVVSEKLQADLLKIAGVREVSDTYKVGKREIKLELLPQGEALGLSLAMLGRQIRQSYYGSLVQSFQRNADEVDVYVRLPRADRETLYSLNHLLITTPSGDRVPLSYVATTSQGRGAAEISRFSRKRSVRVQAQINKRETSPDSVLAKLTSGSFQQLNEAHPDVDINLAGQQEEQQEFIGQLMRTNILALLVIFILLAIPLSSYIQPLIIMSAIPFGMIGAIGGHVILGYDLSMFSLIGVVALSGIVINDSLVMIDLINRMRTAGSSVIDAVMQSGTRRFRAIMLTTLTTFLGLTPLLLEKSIQARFLIPMAISVAFGVVFATVITLLIVPSLYMIIEDIRQIPAKIMRRNSH